jgi:chemotaxis protein MotB
LKAKKAVQADDGPKVPGYIVTYSDMVTLLLTFFVMLLSLAQTQDPELFNSGRDSFVRSIRGLGLGILSGKDNTVNNKHFKNKYPVENPEETDSKNNLDASAERMRRAFDNIQKSMATAPSKISGEKYDYPAAGITFDTRSSELNQKAKQVIDNFCKKLIAQGQTESLSLYVLGLAQEGDNDREKWKLSALRAKAVADHALSTFPQKSKPSIYSWGAGSGKLWTGPDSSIPKGSQILIAVLRK